MSTYDASRCHRLFLSITNNSLFFKRQKATLVGFFLHPSKKWKSVSRQMFLGFLLGQRKYENWPSKICVSRASGCSSLNVCATFIFVGQRKKKHIYIYIKVLFLSAFLWKIRAFSPSNSIYFDVFIFNC